MPMNTGDMTAKMAAGQGFIAALDQSGGSTPKALKGYGVEASAWSNDEEMFGLIHRMRCRRNLLQRGLHRRRQSAHRLELRLVGRKLGDGRQHAMDEEIGDFLEFAGLGDVENVVAAIMQVVAAAADRAQRGVAGNDAG